jgi:uncharacterized protein (TIGR03437 family)
MKRIIVLSMLASAAFAYVPRDATGGNLHRIDFASVQFLVNQNIAPGLNNADGTVWITADSDPLKAIAAALGTWNGVATSAARFAAFGTTTALNANDGQNVIVFSDTPAVRSLVGGALAVTAIYSTGADETITDTDILFSPTQVFSTSFADNTADIQSVVTHELGHSLGANHTNVIGATMFQATLEDDNHWASLSSDDIAFVSALYPAAGGNGNATVSGTATQSGGSPVHGGLVTLVDPAGATVSGFTSVNDGTFKFQAPPGNYFVYVEPLGGYVQPQNLYLDTSIFSYVDVDTNFESTFLGGNGNPSVLTLKAGDNVSLTLQVSPGTAPFQSPYLGLATQGSLYQGPVSISSGQTLDLQFAGPGIDPLTEQNFQIWGGGITIRPGTLIKDAFTANGYQVYRVTLDVAAASGKTLGTIVISKGTDIATLTGVIAVGPPQVVNVGSYLGGAVSPGEVVSFFGGRVGPSPPVFGAFDATGTLSSSLGGVSVTFDGTPAPLFYADPNQVNIQVPYEVAGKQSTTMIANYGGEVRGQFSIPVRSSHPGIVVVTNGDGSLNSPQSPAPVGGIVVIWATGAGVTSIPAKTGKPSPANSTVQTTVNIGGISATPLYAGLTAGGIGLMQVNAVIPSGVAPGNSVPLNFSIGGNTTQTVNISVR